VHLFSGVSMTKLTHYCTLLAGYTVTLPALPVKRMVAGGLYAKGGGGGGGLHRVSLYT
jgi:hypothetical protein